MLDCTLRKLRDRVCFDATGGFAESLASNAETRVQWVCDQWKTRFTASSSTTSINTVSGRPTRRKSRAR